MKIKYNKDLSELVGIILGDGSFFVNDTNAELDIACNLSEKDYIEYVKNLMEKVIESEVYKKYQIPKNCLHLRICKRKIVEKLLRVSLVKAGNKIKNQVTIPKWIKSDNKLLKACVRGLIDTDGSIFRMSKKDYNRPRISFKNNNQLLLQDTRDSFIRLGFHPTNTTKNQIFISRRDEVITFVKDIGFSNKKHQKRFDKILRI